MQRTDGVRSDWRTRNVEEGSSAASDEPDWLNHGSISRELDVRPYQKHGEEPFSAIMSVAKDVSTGSIFVLRNTFEPIPLYGVLGKQGFLHHAIEHGPEDWEIFFYRTDSATPVESAVATDRAEPAAGYEDGWNTPTETITIDVSELVPPEPMIRILETLEDLQPGSSLLVNHVRRPMHLYPRLDELGCRHETREVGPSHVQVLIEKPAHATGTDG